MPRVSDLIGEGRGWGFLSAPGDSSEQPGGRLLTVPGVPLLGPRALRKPWGDLSAKRWVSQWRSLWNTTEE